MDIALTLALFERISGAPFDSAGRPQLRADGTPNNRHGSYGVRLPAPKTLAALRQSLASDNGGGLRPWGRGFEQTAYQPVRVQVDGVDGLRNDQVWPSVSIVETDILPGTDPYLFNDPIEETSGTATITNPITGQTFTGTDRVRSRRHPDPYNMVYTIGVFAKSSVERALLSRSVLYILGMKGAISVEKPDGTFRMVDYFFDRTAMVNQGEAYNPKTGLIETEDRHLAAHHTYIFETHLDNSVQGFGTHDFGAWETTILSRLLEIQSTDGTIWTGLEDLEAMRT
jgi:hypothetical protein